MKALSVYQPWASALLATATCAGASQRLKTIETRGWSTRYRGPVAICAACRWNKRLRYHAEHVVGEVLAAWRDPFRGLVSLAGAHLAAAQVRDEVGRRHRWVLPLGAVLGVVDLVDCVPARPLVGTIGGEEWAMGDYGDERWAWITARPRALATPIPITGRQGLFALPCGVLDQVAAQLAQMGMSLEGSHA